MQVLENKNNLLIMQNNVGNYEFFSYNSKIAVIDNKNNKLYLTDLWDYSQTTLKQLKYFINKYSKKIIYTTKKEFEKELETNKNIHFMD